MEYYEITEVRKNIIEAFGRSFALYGLPAVTGHIYGVLYFAAQPLGLEDIAGELAVSKATVSINIRILEGFKCVRKVWQKGSRRDYYEAERDFTKVFIEVIRNNIKKEVEITTEAIDKSMESLAGLVNSPDKGLREKARVDLGHLKHLEKQYKWYRRLVDMFGTGEKLWRKITCDGD